MARRFDRGGKKLKPSRKVTVYHSRWSNTKTGGDFGGRHYGTKRAGDERLESIRQSVKNQVYHPEVIKRTLGRKLVEKYTLDTKHIWHAKRPLIETTEYAMYKILEVPNSPQRKALIAKGYKGVAYRNVVEDAGSTSYLVWDDSALKKRKRYHPKER